MTGTKSIAASRITVVVLVCLLAVGSSGVVLASIAPAHGDVTTEQTIGSCSLPTLSITMFDSTASDEMQHQFESVIEQPSTGLIDQLSDRGGSVVPPLWAVLLRYSRYDDSDPLDNEVRSQIYAIIEQSPGTYISAVSERVDASRSTVRYHVRILEDEGLIVGDAVRGKHRFSPAGSGDPALAAAMNDEATARVLDSIARLEPAAVSALAEDTDRAPGTISYHLNRLADDELIERERVGNAVVTRLADGIRLDAGDEVEIQPANAD